jgi:hypothetical protein
VYLVGDPGTAKGGNHLDGAEGDVEEDCCEGIETERLDDERAKSRNATTRDAVITAVVSEILDIRVEVCGNLRNSEHEAEPEPRLWIKHGLADMLPLPDAGANTHLVHAETLDGNDFFVLFEEFGLHWRIRHEKAVKFVSIFVYLKEARFLSTYYMTTEKATVMQPQNRKMI